MEGNTGFSAILHETLQQYKEHLDRTELPQLKEHYRILHTAFKGIYQRPSEKGLIQRRSLQARNEDFRDFQSPRRAFFSNPPRTTDEQSVYSMFEYQLDLSPVIYYQFSVEFLDLARVKLLVASPDTSHGTNSGSLGQHDDAGSGGVTSARQKRAATAFPPGSSRIRSIRSSVP
jgi:hypothetical protein